MWGAEATNALSSSALCSSADCFTLTLTKGGQPGRWRRVQTQKLLLLLGFIGFVIRCLPNFHFAFESIISELPLNVAYCVDKSDPYHLMESVRK